MPLVRVCAAGMGSVRSWRTWRAAQAVFLRLDMLKTGRFRVRLGKIRFSHSVKDKVHKAIFRYSTRAKKAVRVLNTLSHLPWRRTQPTVDSPRAGRWKPTPTGHPHLYMASLSYEWHGSLYGSRRCSRICRRNGHISSWRQMVRGCAATDLATCAESGPTGGAESPAA